jgi:hypothetical protein
MSRRDFRQRASAVRGIPLESVLLARGATRDPRDRSKWHTERGPLTITGEKFHDWRLGRGGGGAIDLAMHLAGVDCREAVAWLEHNLAGHSVHTCHERPAGPRGIPPRTSSRSSLRLPSPDERMWTRVFEYLTRGRHLSPALIKPLVEVGKLYADGRGNAVFLLVAGKANRPVGAELRGTGARVWRGMAPGSRKDLGYFWVGQPDSRNIVLCESAIDAISCFQMQPATICISTSGVRADPPWLSALITRGYQIHCGFDADVPGDAAAERLIALHPTVRRLRPAAHDWNDVLTSRG